MAANHNIQNSECTRQKCLIFNFDLKKWKKYKLWHNYCLVLSMQLSIIQKIHCSSYLACFLNKTFFALITTQHLNNCWFVWITREENHKYSLVLHLGSIKATGCHLAKSQTKWFYIPQYFKRESYFEDDVYSECD